MKLGEAIVLVLLYKIMVNGEHTVAEDWPLYYIGDTACMHA